MKSVNYFYLVMKDAKNLHKTLTQTCHFGIAVNKGI